jgi:hypothetical protein
MGNRSQLLHARCPQRFQLLDNQAADGVAVGHGAEVKFGTVKGSPESMPIGFEGRLGQKHDKKEAN